MALAPNEVSSVSMPVRNAAIAASTAPRRCCCATMASHCSCRRCCSVTSSCVETQPPSAIGTLMAWTMRPSLALTVHFEISPAATPSRISLQYCAGSPVNKPVCRRCSINARSVQPGFTTSGDNRYMRRNGWLQITMRVAASNMHKPCDMWSTAALRRRTLARMLAHRSAGRDRDQRAGQAGHHIGKQRGRSHGASATRTTIASPSCSLVNRTPPAVAPERGSRAAPPSGLAQVSGAGSATPRQRPVNASARLTPQYQNLSHSRHGTRVCSSQWERRV